MSSLSDAAERRLAEIDHEIKRVKAIHDEMKSLQKSAWSDGLDDISNAWGGLIEGCADLMVELLREEERIEEWDDAAAQEADYRNDLEWESAL